MNKAQQKTQEFIAKHIFIDMESFFPTIDNFMGKLPIAKVALKSYNVIDDKLANDPRVIDDIMRRFLLESLGKQNSETTLKELLTTFPKLDKNIFSELDNIAKFFQSTKLFHSDINILFERHIRNNGPVVLLGNTNYEWFLQSLLVWQLNIINNPNIKLLCAPTSDGKFITHIKSYLKANKLIQKLANDVSVITKPKPIDNTASKPKELLEERIKRKLRKNRGPAAETGQEIFDREIDVTYNFSKIASRKVTDPIKTLPKPSRHSNSQIELVTTPTEIQPITASTSSTQAQITSFNNNFPQTNIGKIIMIASPVPILVGLLLAFDLRQNVTLATDEIVIICGILTGILVGLIGWKIKNK